MAGKYEAQGTGVHDWITRDRIYTGVIVIGAAIIAALVTLGIISLDDVQGYITLTVTIVGILGGVVGMVTAALAKANVAPAEPDANLRAGTDGTHADYLN